MGAPPYGHPLSFNPTGSSETCSCRKFSNKAPHGPCMSAWLAGPPSPTRPIGPASLTGGAVATGPSDP
eukprot:9483050-Pyramimonas_sp.AAC.1